MIHKTDKRRWDKEDEDKAAEEAEKKGLTRPPADKAAKGGVRK